MSQKQQQQTSWRTEADLDPYNLTRNFTASSSSFQAAPITRTESFQTSRSTQLLKTGFDYADRILTSTSPITETTETTQVTINDQTGIYLNKSDEQTWSGAVSLSDYPINYDPSPTVIEKRLLNTVNYIQPISIKYLKPPKPVKAGDINIKQEQDVRVAKAPPVIIRQSPGELQTPQGIVLREEPPQEVAQVSAKYISICGRQLPPPPRRLVVEKMAQMPEKPQAIEIERWLEYEEQTRAVRFIPAEPVSNWEKEKNLLIVWQPPQSRVTKDLRTLETIHADPNEYRRMYANSLLTFTQMNMRLKDLNIGLPEAIITQKKLPRLTGDLEALKLIDMDRWGLSEYKHLLQGMSSTSTSSLLYDDVWREAVVGIDGQITVEEARRLVVLLYERMGRQVDTTRSDKFLRDVTNSRGMIVFETFKNLVIDWINPGLFF